MKLLEESEHGPWRLDTAGGASSGGWEDAQDSPLRGRGSRRGGRCRTLFFEPDRAGQALGWEIPLTVIKPELKRRRDTRYQGSGPVL